MNTQVRMFEVEPNEQAIITVRGTMPITIMFDDAVIEVSSTSVVYLRRDTPPETRSVTSSQVRVIQQPDSNGEMDTQDLLDIVDYYAGGSYDQVNEEHEARLQRIDDASRRCEQLDEEIESLLRAFYDYDTAGQTQIDDEYSFDETQIME